MALRRADHLSRVLQRRLERAEARIVLHHMLDVAVLVWMRGPHRQQKVSARTEADRQAEHKERVRFAVDTTRSSRRLDEISKDNKLFRFFTTARCSTSSDVMLAPQRSNSARRGQSNRRPSRPIDRTGHIELRLHRDIVNARLRVNRVPKRGVGDGATVRH
jgi:hypothetical protein